VEALKARYWFYRVFLKYMFWIRNKNAKYQWLFIFGIYIGIRFLAMASKDNPTLALIATPLIYLYSAFALSSWIVVPVSNLLLRLNVYGRYALDRDQMKASTFVGLGAIITLAGIVWAIMGGGLIPVIVGFGSMMMLGSMFNPREPNKRRTSVALASALCASGFIAIALDVTGNDPGVFWQIFLYGVIAYQFILNALVTR
jgi:hypothetical protein